MSIQIVIHADNAEAARVEMRDLLGGHVNAVPVTGKAETTISEDTAKAVGGEASQPVAADPNINPATGKKYTKKELAARTGHGAGEVTDVVDLNATQGIQTGGEREPPATGDAFETGVQKAPGAVAVLTLDDVRKAAKPYIDKFTMANASVDLMKCLNDAVPGKDRFSAYEGATQEELAAAVKALQAASAATLRYGQTAA